MNGAIHRATLTLAPQRTALSFDRNARHMLEFLSTNPRRGGELWRKAAPGGIEPATFASNQRVPKPALRDAVLDNIRAAP